MKRATILLILFILPVVLFSYDLTLVSEGEANYLATNWLFEPLPKFWTEQ